ncbi:hypothetical protein, partial [Burkholderia pseudomallei]|uniref:hypothetical protein n=1 Tax=Burkholderia pseudomallei TaxID=28450 RepID=UPI001E38937A
MPSSHSAPSAAAIRAQQSARYPIEADRSGSRPADTRLIRTAKRAEQAARIASTPATRTREAVRRDCAARPPNAVRQSRAHCACD